MGATAPLVGASRRAWHPAWPTQEIWSYASAAALRVTSASAATPIDPAQPACPTTGVPAGLHPWATAMS